MLQVTLEAVKLNWKRYLWSSFVTFATFFVASLALVIKDLNVNSLETAGLVGGTSVLARLVGKAVLEAGKEFVLWLAAKLKS